MTAETPSVVRVGRRPSRSRTRQCSRPRAASACPSRSSSARARV